MGGCNNYPHKKARKELLPAAYGRPCPLCGDLMLKGQPLDLDHVNPRWGAQNAPGPFRMAHARCNRRLGAMLGNRLRAARKPRESRW